MNFLLNCSCMSPSSDEVLIEAKSEDELRVSPLDIPLNELNCYLQNRNSFFFSKHLPSQAPSLIPLSSVPDSLLSNRVKTAALQKVLKIDSLYSHQLQTL